MEKILTCTGFLGRSQWPFGLRRGAAAACLLVLWVRISPGTWMSVCYECCVLSGRGLCVGLITRPEESYRLCYVVVCDLETSWMRRRWPNFFFGGGGLLRQKETKAGFLAKSTILRCYQYTIIHNLRYKFQRPCNVKLVIYWIYMHVSHIHLWLIVFCSIVSEISDRYRRNRICISVLPVCR